MRQGVSSDSDEQVGSSSQSSVTQTNKDKDEMEDVVGGEENVEEILFILLKESEESMTHRGSQMTVVPSREIFSPLLDN